MNILLTGSNGFLGNIIKKELFISNNVYTLSRTNSDFNFDLSRNIPIFNMSFDTIIHCAGKAHQIPQNKMDINSFFDVNVNGTINLLNGVSLNNLPKYFIFISSVSVYGLIEGDYICEDAPLLAKDPYGMSKIQAEKIILDWCNSNNIICTILRLPLIVGDNPKGNLSNMINAINKGYYFNIQGGYSRKSIVMALDVAKIISKVVNIGGIFNLTDGYHPSVRELSYYYRSISGKKCKIHNLPYFFVRLLALVGDLFGEKFPINTYKFNKMTSTLTFDDTKAKKMFGWKPESIFN